MDKILPDFILADLFPSSLVLVEPIKPIKIETLIIQTAMEPNLPLAKEELQIKTPLQKEKLSSTIISDKWFLGNNGKHITILVSEPDAVFLQENSLQFLTKILGACKLNLGDIAVVNILQNSTSFEIIKKELLPTTCILFDVKAQTIELPFTIPYYQIQQYGGCTFLMAPAITAFEGETTEAKLAKTKLWVSLKSIFKL